MAGCSVSSGLNLAGCLLADDRVILENVPDIRDVRTMIELLESLGATVGWEGDGRVVVDPRGVSSGELDPALVFELVRHG